MRGQIGGAERCRHISQLARYNTSALRMTACAASTSDATARERLGLEREKDLSGLPRSSLCCPELFGRLEQPIEGAVKSSYGGHVHAALSRGREFSLPLPCALSPKKCPCRGGQLPRGS